MTKMIKLSVALFFLSTTLPIVGGLKCYECGATIDQDCKKWRDSERECSHMDPVCYKALMTTVHPKGNKEHWSRGCMDKFTCEEREKDSSTSVRDFTKCCKTDFCNGSQHLTSFTLVSLLSLALRNVFEYGQ